MMSFVNYQLHEQETGNLFSYRPLTTHSQELLTQWMKEQNIPNLLSKNKLHCSIILAKNTVPDYKPDQHQVTITPPYKLGLLGPSFSLFFKSSLFLHQWKNTKEHGTQMIWSSYVPHIALSYGIMHEFNYNRIKPPTFQLTFMGEVVDRFDPDFAQKNWQTA